MATSFFKNYLGLQGAPVPHELETSKTAIRALPASWYTSRELYELERRAIFSKKWLLTTHKSRLISRGDWLRYEVAGFQFLIVKDRQDNINAFHNVCRHRAYPIVTKESGNNSILACKYHGWSYGLNGKLAKAPGYKDMEDFDPAQNGLFPLHVHVDNNGFIFVNMDAGEKPEVSWKDAYDSFDELPRFSRYKWDEYSFDHAWQMEGEYDWKILADNYNECYHCKTSHPDITTVSSENWSSKPKAGRIEHFGNQSAEQLAQGFDLASCFFFPNASLHVSSAFSFIQRFVPLGPGKAVMCYEYFKHKDASDEEFKLNVDIWKRIMSEDKELSASAQRNINTGVFVNGEMHPTMELGPLYFQGLVRDALTEHHRRETEAGQEIWPARQTLPPTAKVAKKDVEFCSAVDCCKMNRVVVEAS